MNQRIRILDQHCVNQIAAGEVVERPLSVVKELIENSLDASAKNIEISVKDGGTSLIKVKDDGTGILPDDLRLAVLPHGTSKITSIEDLNALQTLGFRGEALPSIASVSKLSILSRASSETSGYQIQIEGGNVISFTEEGCPIGTLVTVKDLFYNTPARQKFLRSTATEFGLISDMVSRLALARPDVSFTLRHPNNLILNTPGKGNLLETIAAVIGHETARKMLPLYFEEENLKIVGYISPPDLVRASRNGITFIVNGRVIRSQLLNHAIKNGYHTLISSGMYPIAVLSLAISPFDYDVNVHPAKLEIKFKAEKELSEKIANCVRNTLLDNTPIRNITPTSTGRIHTYKEDKNIYQKQDWEQIKFLYKPIDDIPKNVNTLKESKEIIAESIISTNETDTKNNNTFNFQELRTIGQLFNTYILCTNEKSLYCIDQHAAHERIRYNELSQQLKQNSIPAQMLLIPEIVDLTVQEEQILIEHLPRLQDMGFIIEYFGEKTYFLRSVPILHNLENPGNIFKLFLDEIFTYSFPPTQEKLLEKWIFMVACRSAIKGNDRLSIQEMDELIQKLGNTYNPYSCPHGRPIIIEISKQELNSRFNRS